MPTDVQPREVTSTSTSSSNGLAVAAVLLAAAVALAALASFTDPSAIPAEVSQTALFGP
jgi:hypothetical protein